MPTQGYPAPPKPSLSLPPDDVLAIGRNLLAQEGAAIAHVRACLDQTFVQAVAMVLDCAGHVW